MSDTLYWLWLHVERVHRALWNGLKSFLLGY